MVFFHSDQAVAAILCISQYQITGVKRLKCIFNLSTCRAYQVAANNYDIFMLPQAGSNYPIHSLTKMTSRLFVYAYAPVQPVACEFRVGSVGCA